MFPRDLLGTQVLLHLPAKKRKSCVGGESPRKVGVERTHGQRVIRSAFNRCVIDYDDTLTTRYPPYPRDNARTRQGLSRVYIVCGQRRQFKEG